VGYHHRDGKDPSWYNRSFINLMGLNAKSSINLEEVEDDVLLWKAQTDVANPNKNEIVTVAKMWLVLGMQKGPV
jgi:hypothetical protein